MSVITYREALNQALDEEMARDESVFLLGEEVAEYNGAYKVSKGLFDKYGAKRVIDTPITELGFTGLGVGAAMVGLRPVVEWMTYNFSLLAIDQVINNAAKMRHMSGGQISMPIVFRGPNGPAEYLSSQHSQALQSFYAHVPGLIVVAPSTPYDAKGLLKSSIRNDNPVIFLEAEMMYGWQGEVPIGEYIVPIGKAKVVKEGNDVTVLSYSKPVRMIESIANDLENEGIHIEVIDIRSLRPFDYDTVMDSVKKTNRVVFVEESWPIASFGSWVCHEISSKCFDYLDAPVELVASEDVPMPYNHALELAVQPNNEKIIKAVHKVLYR